MAGFKFYGFTILKSQAEKNINDFFDIYEKMLSDKKLKMLDDITEWGDKLIRDIQRHVIKQKRFLEQDHTEQVRLLNEKSREFIEELHVHEHTKNTKQIYDLMHRCNALKFELSALECHPQAIPVVYLTKAETSAEMSLDDFEILENKSERSPKNSLIADDYEAKNNMNGYTDSSLDTTYTNPEQTHAKVSTTNSANSYNRMTSTDDDQQFFDTKSDDLLEKCPVCFMIFPPTLIARDRSQHVQEHYTYD